MARDALRRENHGTHRAVLATPRRMFVAAVVLAAVADAVGVAVVACCFCDLLYAVLQVGVDGCYVAAVACLLPSLRV